MPKNDQDHADKMQIISELDKDFSPGSVFYLLIPSEIDLPDLANVS